MIDYKKKIAEILCSHVTDLTAEEIEEIVEVPQDKSNGDYAFPCFRLAKVLRKAPPLIAKDIAEGIKDDPLFEKVEQVNAYVNMFIDAEEYLKDTLKEALDASYGMVEKIGFENAYYRHDIGKRALEVL